MITMHELLSNQCSIDDVDGNTRKNLYELLGKINKVRIKYNKPMIVTSGLRTIEHHLDIYKRKGITDINKIPMKSNHLYGRAVDISDPNKELQKWCVDNEELLVEIGLWMESFVFTKTWVHFQTKPPLSGRRFFVP